MKRSKRGRPKARRVIALLVVGLVLLGAGFWYFLPSRFTFSYQTLVQRTAGAEKWCRVMSCAPGNVEEPRSMLYFLFSLSRMKNTRFHKDVLAAMDGGVDMPSTEEAMEALQQGIKYFEGGDRLMVYGFLKLHNVKPDLPETEIDRLDRIHARGPEGFGEEMTKDFLRRFKSREEEKP